MKLYNLSFCFLIIAVMMLACKKDKPVHDPFFDLFPKKFVFKKVEAVGSLQMYSNKKEITDAGKIQKFTTGHAVFDVNVIKAFYENDIYDFRNKELVNYTGANSRQYDTLYFTKNNDLLNLKTEPFGDNFYSFNCKAIPCYVGTWIVDSVGCYKSPVWDGSKCVVPIIAINKTFKFVNGEIHIPVLAYRYSSPHFGVTTWIENELNKDVVSRLIDIDTIAIKRFELVFSQQ